MCSIHSTKKILLLISINLLIFGFVESVPNSKYEVPNPTIEVYKKGGFKVSIPDEDGISLFAFHGNVNSPLRNLEAGKFNVDIVTKDNNRWTFQNSDIKLKRGDVINYWLYVIQNGLGYQLLNKQYTVVDYTDEPNCSAIYNTDVTNCKNEFASLQACMKMQSKTLETLVISQSELIRLQKKLNPNFNIDNQNAEVIALESAAENSSTTSAPLVDVSTYKNALLLGGNLPLVQPSQKNYIKLINFILWEKLGLHDIDAISVTPYGEETYVFDVVTTKDKQDVLQAGKTKLTDSTIYIRNFEK